MCIQNIDAAQCEYQPIATNLTLPTPTIRSNLKSTLNLKQEGISRLQIRCSDGIVIMVK